MLLVIVPSIVAALLAIGGYQLLVRKYYWGPGGPPKIDKKGGKENRT